MSVNSRWASIDLVLVLLLVLGIACYLWFRDFTNDILRQRPWPYMWLPSLAAIVGAHAFLARAVLSALSPKAPRFEAARTLARFGFFVLGCGYFFAAAQAALGIRETSSGKISHDMFDALYFSFVTWTTVGYGDLIPSGGLSRFFAVFEALDAYLVMALFIVSLVPGITREAIYYRLRNDAMERQLLAYQRARTPDKSSE